MGNFTRNHKIPTSPWMVNVSFDPQKILIRGVLIGDFSLFKNDYDFEEIKKNILELRTSSLLRRGSIKREGG